MAEDNAVYVGKKRPMDYVTAIITQFNDGSDAVVLKARGKAISTAVDTAEIVRHRFMQDVEIDDIITSTEQLENKEGGTSNVSSIEITLNRSS